MFDHIPVKLLHRSMHVYDITREPVVNAIECFNKRFGEYPVVCAFEKSAMSEDGNKAAVMALMWHPCIGTTR